ncbi:MAG: carboxymuconolactone decarboxylase family protein [Alphaproteobacteria bacterium]
MTRYRDIPPAEMTADQRRVHEAILAGPRGNVAAPFRILLGSPELADRVQRLEEFLRYRSSLAPRLSELAILATAHHWNAPFEWASHVPLALKAGVPSEVIAAIESGRRPSFAQPDEAVVYDVATELLAARDLSDSTFARAVECLGEMAVLDLVGLLGYYSLISILLTAYRVPPPEGRSST